MYLYQAVGHLSCTIIARYKEHNLFPFNYTYQVNTCIHTHMYYIYLSVLLEYIVSTISSVVCEARLFSLFWFAHAINNKTIVCACMFVCFLAKSHAAYLFSPPFPIPTHTLHMHLSFPSLPFFFPFLRYYF